jgi:aspartyl-tRNA(Asn)/glutamyl-tRNA(Gln) amidotransferase subunit A
MSHYDIASAHDALVDRSISCVELVQLYLDRIGEVDGKVHAVLTRLDERALEQADAVDAKLANGEEIGLLEGIPFTAKDMFLITDTRTTAASQILKDFVAPYTSTAIAKLEAAGAICIAKVNQDEYAHGSSTEHSSFGVTHNPRDLNAVPGGSSGGSAAAVAAGIGIFSVGTDTGGSVRQPAAYCGVVGLKPTYGLISRYGVVSMASSLDVVGVLAQNVADARTVAAAMAGQDEHDATTIASEPIKIIESTKKAGYIREYMQGLDPAVASRYEAAYETLRSDGWVVEEVSLPNINQALPCYYILTPSEISSNLERYDGVRYGSQTGAAHDLTSTYSSTRGEFFGGEVQRRILAGTYALSAGYYDAYYKKAMQVRTLIIQDFAAAFADYDVLVGPTAPSEAFQIGAHTDDPAEMYLLDIMTVSANLAGIPAISIPIAGTSDLPLGLQFLAPQQHESALLAAAESAEKALHTQLAEVSL